MTAKGAVSSLAQAATSLLNRDPAALSFAELHRLHQRLLRHTLRVRDGEALWLLSQFYERGLHAQWRLLGKTRPRSDGIVSQYWSRVRRRVSALMTERVQSLDLYLAERYRYAAARAGFLEAQKALVTELRLTGDSTDHELAHALLKRIARVIPRDRSGTEATVLSHLGIACVARNELSEALSYLERWYDCVAATDRPADAVAVLGILYARRWLQSSHQRQDRDLTRARQFLEEAAAKGSTLAESWLVHAEYLWERPNPMNDRSKTADATSNEQTVVSVPHRDLRH
ncbi:hypothetical protein F1559_000473 [Cyanidiococcus yangmingshanensis]|uniref:Uncharacterized protein n=1 Tax=Cyanidiococcus yangmingshanensis TaxID=2690220 RepID=A0A7J7IL93_9RHOD|nr:hypothetical protein F1559_000473 [Cyanidiococcus yangmingshanensis]